MRATAFIALAVGVAMSADAQVVPDNARLILSFDGPSVVTPSRPIVTIQAWATWDPPKGHVFLLAWFDLRVSERGLENPIIQVHPSSTWGTPGPLGYAGAAFGQIHLPSQGILGNPDNPILLGTIDWRATDFAARTVDVWTENEANFRVSNAGKFLTLDPVTSAEAFITVMPCYADCDNSTNLDIFDFLCFQDAFIQADPYADCDGSNTFDIFDFVCFQDHFVRGCP